MKIQLFMCFVFPFSVGSWGYEFPDDSFVGDLHNSPPAPAPSSSWKLQRKLGSQTEVTADCDRHVESSNAYDCLQLLYVLYKLQWYHGCL